MQARLTEKGDKVREQGRHLYGLPMATDGKEHKPTYVNFSTTPPALLNLQCLQDGALERILS